MEEVDVHKLPRKELLQLCTDHGIRTAGVKHDDLVRLLEKKLYPPASDSPRVTAKARSLIGTNSPVSSPKAGSQNSTNSPFNSPISKGKSAGRASLPTPGSTTQGRSLRPLALVDDRSRNNSPEPSPRTPRKDQISPNPGALPRKPATTKSSNAASAPQRSDLLRKKVNTLTAIGKLQAQERPQPAKRSDGSSFVRDRNNVASSPIGKQAQETRRQQIDRGSSIRSRSSAAVGDPKKNIRSTSMPVKRPGERTLGAKGNETSRKGQSTNPNAAAGYPEAAASSPRASEGEASIAATGDLHSDIGSHSFNSVSEIATDAGHHAVWEDSDADDAQSVSSEPVIRFASQSERFHSPRTSTGSKLGRVAYPSWESAHGRRSSLDSSVESNAPLGDLSAAPGVDLTASCSQEDDTAFDLVGDTHELEINSFFDAHSGTPEEIDAAEGSHQIEELRQVEENDVIGKPEKSMKEQDALSETAPSTMQKDTVLSDGNPRVEYDIPVSDCRQEDSSIPAVGSNAPVAEQKKTADIPLDSSGQEVETAISAPEVNGIPEASSRNVTDAIEAETGQVLASKESVEGDKWFDSTLNLVQGEADSTISSPSYQELHYDAVMHSDEKKDPTCCSSKDYTVASTAECIERVHFDMDRAPLPHPDMERTSFTIMSANHPDSSHSTAGDVDLHTGKSASLRDELQQDTDIKLRGGQGGSTSGPKHDHNKDRITKSILLQSDRSEKVPLLQDGREDENSHLARRTFPSSLLLWCSQFFSAIFGTRSCQQ